MEELAFLHQSPKPSMMMGAGGGDRGVKSNGNYSGRRRKAVSVASSNRFGLGVRASSNRLAAPKTERSVWVWTSNKDVMTASVERGWTTFVFTPIMEHLAKAWTSMAMITTLSLRDGVFKDSENRLVAILGQVASGLDQETVKELAGQAEIVVMTAFDWKIISAENLIAAFQETSTTLFATACSATEGRLYFEALERGTDGVVLQTEDPSDVVALKAYVDIKAEEDREMNMMVASVIRVTAVGMGDRVCVDICSLLDPGEGLLVGSFARALFLVHSECLESCYVPSRPFRVNAGPVHAYVALPGGRTSYLSELQSGTEVLVANSEGKTRSAVVGRVKIESRPLVLVEVEEAEGGKHSLLLQNAETVALVSPPMIDRCDGNPDPPFALPVTKLKVGDEVFLNIQGAARHTGVPIQEYIVEK